MIVFINAYLKVDTFGFYIQIQIPYMHSYENSYNCIYLKGNLHCKTWYLVPDMTLM